MTDLLHCPPTQFGLALHTGSPELGLALSNFNHETRQQAWSLGRDLSGHLHSYLAKFLAPQSFADLAFLAVAKGPGGFTGTRIGMVTARTLAQQLDLPLFGISTLAALAWQARSHLSTNAEGDYPDIAVEMPAQRGEVFVAIYKITIARQPPTLVTLLPDQVLSAEDWLQRLQSWETPYHLVKIPAAANLGGNALSILELAYHNWQQGQTPHWSSVVPFYGQHPVKMS